MALATFMIFAGAVGLFYANYLYSAYIVGAFHKYPEPVAQKLRRALYYTNISLSPKNAVKYYSQALEVAKDLGMDPFSDEILGVKIQLAALLEKIGNIPKSVEVLELVRRDCLRWMDEMGELPGNTTQREHVLKQTIAISVKLGELYAHVQMRDREAAEERLVWAVETALREKQRRDREGAKEGESEWMSNEEMGGTLESLAHHYEENNQHYLASLLFLHALNLMPQTNCHSIVLMNNLSISLAQQSPGAFSAANRSAANRARESSAIEVQPTVTNSPSTTQPTLTTHQQLVSNAAAWADRALSVASKIAPPVRNEECDIGCAVATHNLGEFAEMLGSKAEARRRFDEAKSLAKAIGFDDGIRRAEECLARLGRAGSR